MLVSDLTNMYLKVCVERDKSYAYAEGFRDAEANRVKIESGAKKKDLRTPDANRFKDEADRLYAEYLAAVKQAEKDAL